MKRWETAAQARRELDRKFETSDLAPIRARPRSGWIRAIRGSLGMSLDVLANRMHVSKAAAAQLERAELEGGITLRKLSQVAAQLECTLVYALVPDSPLEEIAQRQARKVAARELGYVAQTMRLEAQDVAEDQLTEALEAHARSIIESGRLWRGESAHSIPHAGPIFDLSE